MILPLLFGMGGVFIYTGTIALLSYFIPNHYFLVLGLSGIPVCVFWSILWKLLSPPDLQKEGK